MLTDQLDAMVATGKVSYEELDKFEDAKAQKDLKDLQEGKITQATYDARQAKTDAYFKSRMGAPTTPTEPTGVLLTQQKLKALDKRKY
jgi:major membrane immunogen (membrane-anchored lipoprotein)